MSFYIFSFLFIYLFCIRSLVWRCTGNSIETVLTEIESNASKLFPSPQQGFSSWNSAAPCCTVVSSGGGYSIVNAFWSHIFTLLCGWFSHPQNGSIIQSTGTHPHHSHAINSARHTSRGLDDLGKASSLIKIDLKCIPSKPFLKIENKISTALLQIPSLFPSAHAVIPKIWQVQTVWT